MNRFTLVEVVIALAIMGLLLSIALTITGRTKERTIRSERRWARQHLLNLCSEYFLLAGHDQGFPDEILPNGFSASCTIELVEEGLPDYAIEPVKGWILAQYKIELYDEIGTLIGKQYVDKIVREDEI
ncbi:MAG: type II secretion system protein [Verrucomicrobiota bacterium]|nr:type II secretion system protein [Verrucomicrobiota bacterium]